MLRKNVVSLLAAFVPSMLVLFIQLPDCNNKVAFLLNPCAPESAKCAGRSFAACTATTALKVPFDTAPTMCVNGNALDHCVDVDPPSKCADRIFCQFVAGSCVEGSPILDGEGNPTYVTWTHKVNAECHQTDPF